MKTPSVKTSPVPPPQAIPEVGPEVSDWAMKQARRRSGYMKTFLTGALVPQNTGKKTTLG